MKHFRLKYLRLSSSEPALELRQLRLSDLEGCASYQEAW